MDIKCIRNWEVVAINVQFRRTWSAKATKANFKKIVQHYKKFNKKGRIINGMKDKFINIWNATSSTWRKKRNVEKLSRNVYINIHLVLNMKNIRENL